MLILPLPIGGGTFFPQPILYCCRWLDLTRFSIGILHYWSYTSIPTGLVGLGHQGSCLNIGLQVGARGSFQSELPFFSQLSFLSPTWQMTYWIAPPWPSFGHRVKHKVLKPRSCLKACQSQSSKTGSTFCFPLRRLVISLFRSLSQSNNRQDELRQGSFRR